MHAVTLAALLLAGPPAQAHSTGATVETSLGAVAVGGLIALAGIGYVAGALRLAARRQVRPTRAPRDALWFASGLVLLGATLLGPLDTWSDRSFAAHMVQHELLMLAVAPLLVLGRPLAHWAWALPYEARAALHRSVQRSPLRVAWGAFTGVVGGCVLQTVALWAWHLPAWFRAALDHPGLHMLQHVTFLAVALCFWWSVLRPGGLRRHAARGIASLFVTTLTTGALGALLTFGSTPWYASGEGAPLFGVSDLEDQQLGGLIMWIPGGSVYMVVALLLASRALQRRGLEGPARAEVRTALVRPRIEPHQVQ